jgi:hypothetical protein
MFGKEYLQQFVAIMSNSVTMHAAFALALILLIASMCVNYYSSGSTSYGVMTDTNKCLGLVDGSDGCNAIQALPIIVLLSGILTVIFWVVSNPKVIAKIPGSGLMRKLVDLVEKFGTTAITLTIFTIVMSIINVIVQMTLPVSGGALASQQAQGSIVLKEGYDLSIASTVLFVFAGIILVSNGELFKSQ